MTARQTTDYASLLDEETWRFVERSDSFYPPDAVGLSIAEQRRAYDRMCRAFHNGYPDGIATEDIEVDAGSHNIPLRLYRSAASDVAKATIVYFHGGGFVLGGLESHDDVCAEICAGTGCDLISVDYRLAPENRHPAAFDDALDGYDWASRRRPLPLVLAGDSAGGNLAAAVAHAKRGRHNAPIGQVLIYPSLGGDRSKGSYVAHAEAPMLTLRDLAQSLEVRVGERRCERDPTLQPLADTDFSHLPPTVIVTAECDPLSSDGESYRDRIRQAGGRAVWIDEKGLVHGYLRARHTVKRAAESFAHIVSAIDALAGREWPYEVEAA